MKENTIFIRYKQYGKGSMEIYLDAFFPTSKEKFKKLLKIVDMDCDNSAEIRETLKNYLQKKIPECEAEFRENRNLYENYKQLQADTLRVVKNGKNLAGRPLSKEEREEKKQLIPFYREKAAEHLRLAKEGKRHKEQFWNLSKLL